MKDCRKNQKGEAKPWMQPAVLSSQASGGRESTMKGGVKSNVANTGEQHMSSGGSKHKQGASKTEATY